MASSHDQLPFSPQPEHLRPFDVGLLTITGILDSDSRTQHYDPRTGAPVTEGVTRSMTFGECGVSETVELDGTKKYRAFMTGGKNEGFFVELDAQSHEGLMGQERPSQVPCTEPIDGNAYVMLNVAFPVEFNRAKDAGEVGFPQQHRIRRAFATGLGYLGLGRLLGR